MPPSPLKFIKCRLETKSWGLTGGMSVTGAGDIWSGSDPGSRLGFEGHEDGPRGRRGEFYPRYRLQEAEFLAATYP